MTTNGKWFDTVCTPYLIWKSSLSIPWPSFMSKVGILHQQLLWEPSLESCQWYWVHYPFFCSDVTYRVTVPSPLQCLFPTAFPPFNKVFYLASPSLHMRLMAVTWVTSWRVEALTHFIVKETEALGELEGLLLIIYFEQVRGGVSSHCSLASFCLCVPAEGML